MANILFSIAILITVYSVAVYIGRLKVGEEITWLTLGCMSIGITAIVTHILHIW